ncbi:MAG TPA: DUF6338 family protein [Candidatus Bathyarchaeia archaeon]|nr:DUF6338 family protein [Candidatus Bathyarchaeia archaeon]
MIDLLNSDISSLVEVVFFLLPGFLVIMFFQYLVPSREKSDLQTVVLSVATSVGLSYLTGVFYGILNFLSSLNLNLKPSHFIFSTTSLLIGFLLVALLAKLIRSGKFEKFITRFLKRRPFGRLWHYFLNSPPNTVVKVFTTDNKVYIGIIKEFSIDPSDEIQELELWKPLYYDPFSQRPVRIKEVETVLLEGHAIVSIEKVIPKEASKIYPELK